MGTLQQRVLTDDYEFDMGPYGRKVTTNSPVAQVWFDRGLNWLFGYNHEEASLCFQKALDADPDCAMAHWGIAYCVGPNYNRPWELFDPQDILNTLRIGREKSARAIEKSANASPAEKALIEALPLRYQSDQPVPDLYVWSKDYADAMRAVYRRFPDDPELTLLFAEAMMNRFPWKLWDLKTGAPVEGGDTVECRQVLEEALDKCRARGQQHPGLWHAYIHTMEMSPFPEKALNAADELRLMQSDSGHLPHMPTHIYIQCGHYKDVVRLNEEGIARDTKYWEAAGAMNFYSLYRLHNYHFKQYGAMFLGQYEPSIEAVRDMHATIPDALIRVELPPMADWLEPYMTIGTHTYVRFGKWQELIDDPLPEDQKVYCTVTALNWYGRGVAYANLKLIDKALEARETFRKAAAAVPASRHLHNVPVSQILALAEEMLTGELEYHRGNHDLAFAHLRKAVELEDAMPYDEPWGWMLPSRHALGALLSDQGRFAEAAEAYEADLGLNDQVMRCNQHPGNVWALLGLHRCYVALGLAAQAALIKPQLDFALARADSNIYASCFCASKQNTSSCCG